MAGVASGLFAGRGARWLTTTHWLTSNKARTIRNRTARATIVARFGTWSTRGPREETLCAVVSRSQRGKRVISRAAIRGSREGRKCARISFRSLHQRCSQRCAGSGGSPSNKHWAGQDLRRSRKHFQATGDLYPKQFGLPK